MQRFCDNPSDGNWNVNGAENTKKTREKTGRNKDEIEEITAGVMLQREAATAGAGCSGFRIQITEAALAPHPSSFFTTFPSTSVSRKSRPR